MYEKSETAPPRDRIKRLLRIAAALAGLGLLIRLNPLIDLIGLADVWMNRYEGLSAWGFGWRAAVEMFAVGAALLTLLRLFGRGSTLPNLRDLLPVLRFFGLGKKASFHASNRRSVKNVLIDLIAAPALYAAALQAVPMFVLSRFDAGAGTQLAVSVYLSALFFHRRGSWSWLFWGTQNLYAATAFVYGVGVSWAGAFGLAFALHASAHGLNALYLRLGMAAVEGVKIGARHWRSLLAVVCAISLAFLLSGGSYAWAFEWLTARYSKHGQWAFCLWLALETVVVSLLLAPIGAFVDRSRALRRWLSKLRARLKPPKPVETGEEHESGEKPTPPKKEKRKPQLKKEKRDSILQIKNMRAAQALAEAPIYETFAMQAAPVVLLKLVGADLETQAAAAAALFAFAHFTKSAGSGIAAGLPGGVYLGFAFAHWLGESFWTAFWVTAVAHSLHNLPTAALIGAYKLMERIEQKRKSEQEKPPVERE